VGGNANAPWKVGCKGGGRQRDDRGGNQGRVAPAKESNSTERKQINPKLYIYLIQRYISIYKIYIL
jgi:hypothetical protein